MNLSQMRDEVYNLTGFPVNDGLVTPDKVDGHINRALRHIGNMRPWRWLQATDADNTATVAGTDTYTLPSDYVATRSLTIGGSVCRRVTIDELDALPILDNRSTPTVYAIEGDSLILYPTPADAQTIVHRYNCAERTLTQATMTPLLPAAYHDIITNRAAYTVLMSTGDATRAAMFRTEDDEVEKRLLGSQQSVDQRRIRVRPGGGL